MNHKPSRVMTQTRTDESGCWIYTGPISQGGYGRLGKEYAHRIMYEAIHGEIPPGLDIDHLCRNRRCCNPQHLEAVTRRENLLRGMGWTAINARKTHCKRGHEFTDENTRHDGRGRQCRACDQIRKPRKVSA